VESLKVPLFEDKLAAIKAYRHAKGLCYMCSTKWALNHICAPTISLHMVEELWQLLPDSPEATKSEEYDFGEDLMSISIDVVNGTKAPKTLRVMGSLFCQLHIILVDSSNYNSFIIEQMAASSPSWVPLQKPIEVRVANGCVLMCIHELQNCQLVIQEHCFSINLKILPLKCYDIVLGMDWLESCSPMEVHWTHKWLAFSHQGQHIKLQGILPQLHSLEVISDVKGNN